MSCRVVENVTVGDEYGVVLGAVVRVSANDTVTNAQSDTEADAQGTVGIATSAASNGSSLIIQTNGKCEVRLESAHATPNPGEYLWLSQTEAGRATTGTTPGADHIAGVFVGVIKSVPANFLAYQLVTADVTPIPYAVLYDIPYYFPGVPLDGMTMLRLGMVREVFFPADLDGSYATAEFGATAETVLTLAQGGTPFGTITFGAGSSLGIISSTAATFAVDDVFTIVNQNTADLTLANISITIKAIR